MMSIPSRGKSAFSQSCMSRGKCGIFKSMKNARTWYYAAAVCAFGAAIVGWWWDGLRIAPWFMVAAGIGWLYLGTVFDALE